MPTDVFRMTQTDLETQSPVEDAPAPGRFPCPVCGSMLRVGAILCPHCEADLWTMAHGGPAPSGEARTEAAAEAPPAVDGPSARRSLAVAAVALAAMTLASVVPAAVEGASRVWSLSAWVATLAALYAIHLARKAGGRLEDTRDERRPITAKYGLVLGMVTVAYALCTLITSSIDGVVGHLHP
jgi:hypothetical protein